MSSQLALERRSVGTAPPDGSPLGMVAAAAAVRGAAVAVSGALLAAAISLVLWALTPASGSDATVAVKAGIAGFAAANLIPVTIGGVALTIPPLLFTLLIAGLLVGTARRGRFLPVGRNQETAAVLITSASYGLAVAVITRGFAPEGVVPAAWVWTAAALAFATTAGTALAGGPGWRQWWRDSVSEWLQAAFRAAGIGLGVVIAGSGLALTVAMVAHFGSIVSVGALAAPSWTDGLGMALLGAAYVPNAIVAAAGYISGVGFEVGPGTYSPFAANTVDLPALPLLAAAPDHAGRSLVGIAFLAVPLIGGYLMARRVAGSLESRSERATACAAAAAMTGILLGCLAWVARGGVGNARWSSIGASPLLLGAVVAVELGAVAVATAVLTGARTVPWRVAEAVDTDAVDPDAVDTEAVDSDAVDSDAVDSDAVDSDAVDSDAADTDLAGLEDTDPTRSEQDLGPEADADNGSQSDVVVTSDSASHDELEPGEQVGDDRPATGASTPREPADPAGETSVLNPAEPDDSGGTAPAAAPAHGVRLPEQRIPDDGPAPDRPASPVGSNGDTVTDGGGPEEAQFGDDERSGERNDHHSAGRRQ